MTTDMTTDPATAAPLPRPCPQDVAERLATQPRYADTDDDAAVECPEVSEAALEQAEGERDAYRKAYLALRRAVLNTNASRVRLRETASSVHGTLHKRLRLLAGETAERQAEQETNPALATAQRAWLRHLYATYTGVVPDPLLDPPLE